MKFKLSRSRSTSPPSSTPPSPRAASCSSSPTSASPRKPRFPFTHLGRSSSSPKRDSSSEISEVSSPKHTNGNAKSPAAPDRSTSRSARHGKVSEGAMHEIQQVFAHFDTNGDGKISAEELRAVLALMGDETTSEEAALMVREVDRDGDGYINLEEFVDLNAECMHCGTEEEEMAAAFAIFDLDNNGRITAEELQEVLRRLGGGLAQRTSVEDCKRMIRGVDRKGVGHVDFDDFKRMMTPLIV